jgi:NAD(P)H-dependent nitrite reductase small subunit
VRAAERAPGGRVPRRGEQPRLFAIDNYDPNSDAAVLSRGLVGSLGERIVVASPIYKQHFDLQTGECLEAPHNSVAAIPVRVEDGKVWVGACDEKAQSLVVIGNGMAGMRTVEELLKLGPDLYASPCSAPSRTGTTTASCCRRVLAGEKSVDDIMLHTRAWYAEATASPCMPATRSCASTASAASRARFRPGSALRPPADRDRFDALHHPGAGPQLPGVIGFRDLHDVDTMLARRARAGARSSSAAACSGWKRPTACCAQGMDVTVVHVAASLMNQQLDPKPRPLLRGAGTARPAHPAEAPDRRNRGRGPVQAVRFADGSEFPPTWS